MLARAVRVQLAAGHTPCSPWRGTGPVLFCTNDPEWGIGGTRSWQARRGRRVDLLEGQEAPQRDPDRITLGS